jgi:small subunit ribosomal protein S3
MGQKTSAIGNRLGIIRGWESNWFGGKDMALKVVEDEKIRKYLGARINKGKGGGIARIVIERTLKRVTVTIQTARPGIIIGRGGEEVDRIREELRKLINSKDEATKKEVQINILEIRKPEIDAAIVGETIAKQLEGRINFRRAIKTAIQAAMRSGAEGIKVRIGGRLNGADMARTEEFKEGRIPLHTFRADIDYALSEAQTVYGKLGIKVWICKGEILGKRELTAFTEGVTAAGAQTASQGGNDNRGGGGDRRNSGGGGDRRNSGGGDRRNSGGGGDRRNTGGGDGGPNNNRGGGGGANNNRGGGGGNNNNRGGGGGGGNNNNRGGGGGGGNRGGGGGGGNRGGGGGGKK